MEFLVLLGPPGSGKGTLSRMLEEIHGFVPLSTGEEIRKRMADPDSGFGRKAAPYMDRGDYIPDELAMELFREIADALPGDVRMILDGFPRTIHQAEWFVDWTAREDHNLQGCLYLDISPEEAVRRMERRLVCPRCRRTFPTVAGNPVGDRCDTCDVALHPREDDDPRRMRMRIQRHREQTVPLRDWFRERSGKVIELDAGKPTETLCGEVEQQFGIAT